MKVYGPYLRQDGRSIVIHYDGTTRRTQSYPRYLMEQKLGRKLLSSEHVDHINGDCSDNTIENLQLLSQYQNNIKSIIENGKQAKYTKFNCPVCNKEFSIETRRYLSNQLKQNKAGPYCSKSCAGKLHH